MSAIYTLSSITEEIASHLGKELDEPFKRLLADKVHAWRSQLLRRTLKENPAERIHFKQSLLIKLEKVKQVAECAVPGNPVCDIMRSTVKIPAPVRAGSVIYDYVGGIDGTNPFKRVTAGFVNVFSHSKYSGKTVVFDEVNDYLEVYNAIGLPAVRIDGVFDNFEQVFNLSCEAGAGNCDIWETPYPVSGDIKQAIVECILKVDYQQVITPKENQIEVTPKQ